MRFSATAHWRRSEVRECTDDCCIGALEARPTEGQNTQQQLIGPVRGIRIKTLSINYRSQCEETSAPAPSDKEFLVVQYMLEDPPNTWTRVSWDELEGTQECKWDYRATTWSEIGCVSREADLGLPEDDPNYQGPLVFTNPTFPSNWPQTDLSPRC